MRLDGGSATRCLHNRPTTWDRGSWVVEPKGGFGGLTIPDYQGLIRPILGTLAEAGGELTEEALLQRLAGVVGATAADLAERLPSGQESVFAHRVEWALAYLKGINLVTDMDGQWRLTAAGSDWAARDTGSSDVAAPSHSLPLQGAALASDADPSPEAAIACTIQMLHHQLRHDLLARIHEALPRFFERLIIELLVAMGYGGRRHDLARHLGRSGDGGIDGAVPLDPLGLDVVYVQAKRYRPGVLVPVSEVRDFAGSLEAHKAGKGVFVTTASFPNSAKEFVSALPRKIVLIDGEALADHLIRYGVGVRLRHTYEVKAIDESYFTK